MQHHTKEKGDLAVAIADMKKNGIGLALPISEHMPFDLIAVDTLNNHMLRRVQVKHSKMVNGKILIKLRNRYSDSKGTSSITVDRSCIDAYAIYCPDTAIVHSIKTGEIPSNAVSNIF